MLNQKEVIRKLDAAESPETFWRTYVGFLDRMWRQHRATAPWNPWAYFLDHAQTYAVRNPAEKDMGAPRGCYQNSIYLAGRPGWRYVEGFVHVYGVSISHAWVLNGQGEAVEPTIDLDDARAVGCWVGIEVPRLALILARNHPRWAIAGGVLATYGMMRDAELAEVAVEFGVRP